MWLGTVTHTRTPFSSRRPPALSSQDFSVVPQLCSARQLDAVFDSVNNCQDADDDADALDGLEFNETLVRLGVLYGPGYVQCTL